MTKSELKEQVLPLIDKYIISICGKKLELRIEQSHIHFEICKKFCEYSGGVENEFVPLFHSWTEFSGYLEEKIDFKIDL